MNDERGSLIVRPRGRVSRVEDRRMEDRDDVLSSTRTVTIVKLFLSENMKDS